MAVGLFLFAVSVGNGNSWLEVNAEQEFIPGSNFEYFADAESAYTGVSFEYKITSGNGDISICVLGSGWQDYYGYFSFDKSGAKGAYSGVFCEHLSDGYIKVSIDFENVDIIVGERPQKTRRFFARGDLISSSGSIRKIEFLTEKNNEKRNDYNGKKCTEGRNAELTAPIAAKYGKVVFEYILPDDAAGKKAAVCLLESTVKNYYGYYDLTSEGVEGRSLDGITCTKLDDGYFRVVMKVDKLKVFTNTTNEKYRPYDIKELFIRGEWSTSDVYIRNLEFLMPFNFSMQEGAATRLEKPYGLKFKANISENYYDPDALYGMIIVPSEYIERYAIKDNYHVELNKRNIAFNDECLKVKRDNNLDYYVEGYIVGLKDDDLKKKYVGIAYEYCDGEYNYAVGVEKTKRSIAEVSDRAILDTDSFRDYSSGGQALIRETVGCSKISNAFSLNGFDSNVNFKKDETIPTSRTLSLSAAKGEKESGAIVLSATAALEGKTYTITPYDLTHEDGGTKLSQKNVSAFNGHYIEINSNYRHVIYPENGATDLGTGYYLMNALVPFSTAAKARETVFDLTNGKNQTIIVDFDIPRDQKAGKYVGEFRIDVLGVGYKIIPIEFTVYDFALPEDNNAKNIFAIPTECLKDLYGVDGGYQSTFYKDLYDFLLDFNVNAGRLPDVPVYGDYGWQNYLDTLVEYSSDPRVSTINLYSDYDLVTYQYTYDKTKYFLGYAYGTEEVTETLNDLIVLSEYDRQKSYINVSGAEVEYTNYGLRTILKKLAEYAVENNVDLFKKMIVNSPQNDEPSSARTYVAAILSYNAVRRSIDYVLSGAGIDWTGHEDIKASLDNVPFLVTVSPTDEVIAGNKLVDSVKSRSAYIPADSYNSKVDLTIDYKYLKDFIPLVAFFDDSSNATYNARLNDLINDSPDAHTHVWWYSCCTAVNPYLSYGANADRVIMRASRWALYGMGVEGELYFAVNKWCEIGDDENITVLTEDEIWQGKSNQAGLIEDGVLVYPNDMKYEDADFRFCATSRLYAIRESIDDYNYLCYAKQLINRLSSGDKKTKAISTIENILKIIYTDGKTITDDANVLRNARADLATLIYELL